MSAQFPDSFDVVVVGAGHAGCEAALAAARLGAKCLLATINLEHIAALSCNPAVGGLAKGHLVKEIDALGGEMGLNTDATGIQFRLLNQGKGPAVWSSRAQVDIDRYPARMAKVCAGQPGLWLLDDEVRGLVVDGGRVAGIRPGRGGEIAAKAVILTTGTFLRGVIHVGLTQSRGGRMGDPPADALSQQLKELGFNLGRLKTGTTPRLDIKSLDLEGLPQQPGDDNPRMFSFLNTAPVLPQRVCWLSHTTEATHELIRANLDQAPMYAGVITGVGARYCPSLEDKVVRFPDKDSHQVFLEPQGLDSPLIYPNGIPTSLPAEVQHLMVRTLPGCGRAVIVRPGYAIEYDYSDPRDLTPWLESKHLAGLYMAGQINGTSGYEEAGAQGLWAGINAARGAQAREPVILNRSQAYLGVLIDDLVTKGTLEPYRMFTSRAEFRLTLREDNADLRLTPLGRELGLVDDHRWAAFTAKRAQVERALELLEAVRLNPTAEVNGRLAELGSAPLRRPHAAHEILRRPGMDLAQVATLHPALAELAALEPAATEQVQIKAAYAGYEKREREQVERFRAKESLALPPDLDYQLIEGLSHEVKEKLSRVRPASLGQAARISGITPAALAVLQLTLHRRAMAAPD
ncbi:MAG: tRNA uridine-5-carboxymethylaminomethyl(34) synthesis enzyme MnmG [Desulfarculaceae bacterium]|nr:tRNA uridine-5-carboxymethylaminomethyl(34) synthesis enzyme MnmG [Desulfarculaceae bacterium]MCF8047360.1 tRNA uridine-5-carboxymethylaminomethyl(34) synthesis enzyme MnmG [Desulfarculaceae bacterium]MCF8122435.1 tRNA uridine-5-carboxymethylaminomethyl(34) synthesis enzyme MnmG [Desulfarculaceae bacterium]